MAFWNLITGKSQDEFLEDVIKADRLRADGDDSAQAEYRKIIKGLQKKYKKRKLTKAGSEALGRAFYGEALLLQAQGKKTKSLSSFRQASKAFNFTPEEVALFMAPHCLSDDDTSMRAMNYYVTYLRLPDRIADPELTDSMLEILEDGFRIDEDDSPENIASLIGLNLKLMVIPHTTPSIVVINGRYITDQFVVEGGESKIGRRKDNDIVMPDGSVSGYHARIIRNKGEYVIEDLNSSNGTRVDGEAISAPTPIMDGTLIQIANHKALFFSEPRLVDRELEWANRNLGVGYFAQQDYTKAARCFDQLRKKFPGNVDAHYYLGRINEVTGTPGSAMKCYVQALKLDDTHSLSHFATANLLYRVADTEGEQLSERATQQLTKALQHLRKATEIEPENPDYLFSSANVMDALALPAGRVIEMARSAIALNPDEADYHGFVARVAYESDDTTAARDAALRTIELDPEHNEAMNILGIMAYDANDYSQAIHFLEKLRISEARQKRAELSASTEFAVRLGHSLFEEGEYAKATKILSPKVEESRDAMFYAGRCHSRLERFESAEKIFAWLLSLYGEDAQARYFLGCTQGNQNKLDESIKTIEPLKSDPEWRTRSLCMSGKILARLGKLDEADTCIAEAHSSDPENRAVLLETGRMAYIRGDFAEAASFFRQALLSDESDPVFLLWLGRALFATKDYEEAEKHLLSAVTLFEAGDDSQAEDLHADAHFYLGRVARIQGKKKEAISHFEKARTLGQVTDLLLFELSLLYAQSGRQAKAIDEFSSLAARHENDASILFNQGAVLCFVARKHLKEGNEEQAIQLFQQAAERFRRIKTENAALEAESGLVEACFRAAVKRLLSESGDIDLAVEHLEQARSIAPDDSRNLYVLGICYFKAGDFKKAGSVFQELVNSQQEGDRARRGLVLSLENAGEIDNAEAEWKDIVGKTNPCSKDWLDAQLGLAGFYSRRELYDAAARVLLEILGNDVHAGFDDYESVVKMAASYLNLAGDQKAAEETVRKYLSDASSDTVQLYLVALMAWQGQVEQAYQLLNSSLDADQVHTAEILEMFELLSRTLASRQILKNNLTEAKKIITVLADIMSGLSAETGSLREALETALALKGSSGSAGSRAFAELIPIYKNASQANPQNYQLKRSLAVLHQMTASEWERENRSDDASGHWRRALSLWQSLSKDTAFWSDFFNSYNRTHRHKKDHLGEKEIRNMRSGLYEKLSTVHVEYAKAYVKGNSVGTKGFAAHCELAISLNTRKKKKFSEEFADILFEEGSLAYRDTPDEQLKLARFILKELSPSHKECSAAISNYHFQKAQDALAAGNVSEFRRLLKIIAKDVENPEMRSNYRKCIQASDRTISKILTTLNRFLNTIPSHVSPRVKEQARFLVVVLLSAAFDPLPYNLNEIAFANAVMDTTVKLINDIQAG